MGDRPRNKSEKIQQELGRRKLIRNSKEYKQGEGGGTYSKLCLVCRWGLLGRVEGVARFTEWWCRLRALRKVVKVYWWSRRGERFLKRSSKGAWREVAGKEQKIKGTLNQLGLTGR